MGFCVADIRFTILSRRCVPWFLVLGFGWDDRWIGDERLELMKGNVADERYVGSYFASIPW